MRSRCCCRPLSLDDRTTLRTPPTPEASAPAPRPKHEQRPQELKLVDHAIVAVCREPRRLALHPLAWLRRAWQAVDRSGEVEALLDRPDVVVAVRWQDRRGIADGDPADGDEPVVGERRVDVDDAVDAHLRPGADARAREQRDAGRQEGARADGGTVHVRVRTDQDVVLEPDGVRLAPAHERVLHDDAARADVDPAVLGAQYGAEEDPGLGPDAYVAAQHGVRRDVRAGVDGGGGAAVFEDHG